MRKQSLRLTIQTRERLNQLRTESDDSYDSILNRLLDAKLGTMNITYKLSEDYNVIYATIDYNQMEPNILFKYEDNFYSTVDELPISLNFKKKLKGFDFFGVLPLMNVNEKLTVNNILISVVSEGVR